MDETGRRHLAKKGNNLTFNELIDKYDIPHYTSNASQGGTMPSIVCTGENTNYPFMKGHNL